MCWVGVVERGWGGAGRRKRRGSWVGVDVFVIV